mmetsp:Transcript_129503/g.415118  ORF Transcript_129503/g.415118 Transcript_129503/m.415118 type:complete len:209 (-) Transcript_129503:700-1326(-)
MGVVFCSQQQDVTSFQLEDEVGPSAKFLPIFAERGLQLWQYRSCHSDAGRTRVDQAAALALRTSADRVVAQTNTSQAHLPIPFAWIVHRRPDERPRQALCVGPAERELARLLAEEEAEAWRQGGLGAFGDALGEPLQQVERLANGETAQAQANDAVVGERLKGQIGHLGSSHQPQRHASVPWLAFLRGSSEAELVLDQIASRLPISDA